ncbi:MAG: hypothetical protein NTY53_03010 [Kiritimatiellaeota bacterium]|nr:hypothetical protein [Kiritimatiellota bacterium]
MKNGYSKDWKVEQQIFPRLGKTDGIFSNAWNGHSFRAELA